MESRLLDGVDVNYKCNQVDSRISLMNNADADLAATALTELMKVMNNDHEENWQENDASITYASDLSISDEQP